MRCDIYEWDPIEASVCLSAGLRVVRIGEKGIYICLWEPASFLPHRWRSVLPSPPLPFLRRRRRVWKVKVQPLKSEVSREYRVVKERKGKCRSGPEESVGRSVGRDEY
jgi:hypothetical protein